jgi:two-component system sensor histidine kinase YesM
MGAGMLTRKIVAFFLIVGIVPALIVSIYYSANTISVLQSNIGASREVALRNTLSRFDSAIGNLIEFTDWVFLDKDINDLLTNIPEELDDYQERVIDAADNIAYHISYSQVSEFLSTLFVFGNNGIDFRFSNTSPAYVVSRSDLLSYEWVNPTGSVFGKPRWASPIPPIHPMFEDRYLVPMVRSILDIESPRTLGTLIAFINERIFDEIYDDYGLMEGESLLFAYPSGVILSSNREELLGTGIQETEELAEIDESFWSADPDTASVERGQEHLVASIHSDRYDWSLIDVIPVWQIQREQRKVLLVTLGVFGLSIFLTVILAAFLTRNINRPIHALIGKIEGMPLDRSATRAAVRSKDEIGLLEQSIDTMSAKIRQLMEDQIAEERERHEIELRLLQSQINPHFLYNTLGVIKWMAMLQGADTIGVMVTAMSKVFKYAIGKTSQRVCLGEELEMLDEYLRIHQLGGKHSIDFQKHVADPRLLKCHVIKFILQPIVENAIIHGLKPKHSGGRIDLTVSDDDGLLRITVHDNGIGFPPEELRKLTSQTADEVVEPSGHVGLNNIARRIQLLHGNPYGVEIQSEFGKYTSVTVTLPLATPCEQERV